MRAGRSVLKEMRDEKIMIVAGTALATIAAGIGLYNVLTKEPEVAADKQPTVPTEQQQPVAPATRGSAAETR